MNELLVMSFDQRRYKRILSCNRSKQIPMRRKALITQLKIKYINKNIIISNKRDCFGFASHILSTST